MAKLIVVSALKKLAKENDRRVGADFLTLLDAFVLEKFMAALGQHNGTKKTLDAVVAGYVGIAPKKGHTPTE